MYMLYFSNSYFMFFTFNNSRCKEISNCKRSLHSDVKISNCVVPRVLLS